ncbi:MAG TPA: hypothetical protein VNT81_23655 [Vicinamibacterales bacterium]|nr:hypothetical protein [Vicinamibacterales bacterium]
MNRAARAETWLPLAIAVAWWAVLYPGLFGEDSLITLEEARSGNITVWFTAWWVYIIDALSLNTRAIPLLTLAGVLVFAWSVRDWAAAVFPAGRARTWAIVIICATPLVGGLGVQVRHDAWMTAGFLFALAAITRALRHASFDRWDYARLALACLLIPTRHNGLATLIAASAIGLFVLPRRFAMTLIAISVGVFAVTQAATRASGQPHSIDPVQAVEWMMADVSCMIADPSVALTDEEWARLEPIADRGDWRQPVACRFVSPLLIAPSFRPAAVEAHMTGLARTWLSLGWRYPGKLTYVHARRVNLFLPPFVGGAPQQDHTPFIHSTILPNNFGLEWAFPRIAEAARLPLRAWNAMRAVLANAAIWLVALGVIAWQFPRLRAPLMPTLITCVGLELGLLATAPISEGRYGLLMLVTGQLALLYLALERRSGIIS